MNLTKELKNLYTENYKTLRKEIEEDTKKMNDISSSQIRKINIVKMPTLPKGYTDAMHSLSKYQWHSS